LIKLAANTWFSDLPFEKAIEVLSNCGFGAVEIAATRENLADVSSIARRLDEHEAEPVCVSIGVPFFRDPENLSLHSPSEDIRKASIRYVFDSIDFAARIEIPLVYVCSVTKDSKQTDPEKIFSKSLSQCGEYSAKAGVSLALEHFPFGLFPSFDDAVRIVSSITAQRNLGVVYDIGHHAICSNKDEFPPKDPSLLLDVHLNNNDGVADRHWPPMNGIITRSQFVNLFTELKKINYEKCISVELANVVNAERTWRDSKKFLTDLIQIG
jgi:sugar phosphate isomerase/epimerase